MGSLHNLLFVDMHQSNDGCRITVSDAVAFEHRLSDQFFA
jgi:hypothetical protein